jgi:serine/threonine protein kinase
VKVLLARVAADPSFQKRFHREARHIASLSHPNIVKVYDFGVDGDLSFIVMEYVEGQSLRQILGTGRMLPLAVTSALAIDTLSALDHAHARGIVHRDVKPGNILISTTGTAKVADFGVAKSSVDTTELTVHGSFVGTASYASPEQLMGRPIGPASDLYSLGCVLYQCLVGRPPFEADDVERLALQHRVVVAEPISSTRSDVPESVASAISRALAKDPADRFASAQQMIEMIIPVVGSDPPEIGQLVAGTDEVGSIRAISIGERTTEAGTVHRPTGIHDPTGDRSRRPNHFFRWVSNTPTRRRGTAALGLLAALLIVILLIVLNLNRDGTPAGAFDPSVIRSGGFLQPGQSIYSSNGHFRLTMQSDGNLVDYAQRGNLTVWESGTSGNFGAYAVVQSDGDFVVYPKGQSAPPPGDPTPALWSSGTYGHPGASVELENGGSVVVREAGRLVILWKSSGLAVP